jgi:diguanylate cyclase (GGDEF)-like protein
VALLFLDLDHFKSANDRFGHDVGDTLLRQVAQRVRATVGPNDTPGRLGGDEFVVLLNDLENEHEAMEIAKELQETIGEPYRIDGFDIRIGVSIGIAVYPNDGFDAGTLLKHADMAMYEAKSQGRNQCHYFSDSIDSRATARFEIESLLRRAVANEGFVLHFQPKVEYPSQRIIGAEALIRLPDVNGQLRSPAEFILLAEETGLITPMGRWVLREACSQIATWQQAGIAMPVAVNVSAVQLRSRDFLSDIIHAITTARIPPHLLELELTESVFIEARDIVQQYMGELQNLGVKLSIDDFGTGYSSLSYLHRIPAANLKIDRSFVVDIATKPATAAITKTIINLAENLGLGVIAEGVETAYQAQALFDQGCRVMQGYHFYKPMPADQLTALQHSQLAQLRGQTTGHLRVI